jgi:uracil-DNA glycosylase family 4
MRIDTCCPNCPNKGLLLGSDKPISGDYNRDEILFVGEQPGKEERARHRIFIGASGQEFNETYLPLAGLSRTEVSLTNTVKCWTADSGEAPNTELIKSCSQFHLKQELAYHQPRVVCLMGAVANSLLKIDVDMDHGIPRKTELLGHSCYVFPTYHPALGLHMSSKMLQLVDDFRRLKAFLRGDLQVAKDRYPIARYFKLTDPGDVAEIMNVGDWLAISVDTESKKRWRGYPSTVKYIPWCISFSVHPGEGFVIRVGDVAAMSEFLRCIDNYKEVVFHNSPYDYDIITRIHTALAANNPSLPMIPWSRVRDTMAMAYHDGRVPKGLKALAYRLLGKRMTSFDEVVVPHSHEAALEYIERAMSMDWPKPVQVPTGMAVTKKCPDCKGTGQLRAGRGKAKRVYACDCEDGLVTVPKMTRKQGMNDKLYRLVTDLKKKPNLNVWERWEGWGTDVDPLIRDIGPLPLPSIEYVPEDEAIQYAAGDADATLQIYPLMKQRLAELRRSVR